MFCTSFLERPSSINWRLLELTSLFELLQLNETEAASRITDNKKLCKKVNIRFKLYKYQNVELCLELHNINTIHLKTTLLLSGDAKL